MKIPAVLSMTLIATLAWAAPNIDGTPLKGRVLETADGGSYIYLKLGTSQGEIWAATMKQTIPKGAQIVIHDPTLMTNFNSKALNRTFDQIVFGSVVTLEGQGSSAPMAQMAQMAAAHKNSAAAASATIVPVIKAPKAPGANGRTVAEIYAQRAKLTGKQVAVQGTVVKFSADIMDRNWIHLRDGTGSAADKSNDLIVTTKEKVKVGDVVVASGLVKTDVNYGSGYAYPVVVEGATLN